MYYNWFTSIMLLCQLLLLLLLWLESWCWNINKNRYDEPSFFWSSAMLLRSVSVCLLHCLCLAWASCSCFLSLVNSAWRRFWVGGVSVSLSVHSTMYTHTILLQQHVVNSYIISHCCVYTHAVNDTLSQMLWAFQCLCYSQGQVKPLNLYISCLELPYTLH